MKIGILATHFAKGQPASSEPHLVNLVNAMSAMDRDNQYILFARTDNIACFNLNGGNFKAVVFPGLCRYVWFRILCEQLIVPVIALVRRLDVLHFTANAGPALLPCKSVGTIHWTPDPLVMATFPWYKRVYFALLFKLSIRKANKLIAVSQSCKMDAIHSLELEADKIVVVPHGVGQGFVTGPGPDQIASARARYRLPEKYLLCVTSTYPYKALPVTLAAFVRARTRYGIPHRLVLVGNIDLEVFSEMERQVAPDFAWADEVIVTGYLPYEELPAIYGGASALVYVSLRETFGLALLEAMASGVPVVISNIPALVEVAQDAAVIVETNDVDHLAEAIYQVISTPELREQLIQKGLARVREFSWERAAQQTIDVYRKTMQT
jgi:glycosyltransferase involved in cell wall biosynthesis